MSTHREPVPKFYCAACGHETASRVLDTRGRRRRRECIECGHTFPTLEQLAPANRPSRHVARSGPAARLFDLE